MIDGSWNSTHLVGWNDKVVSIEENGAIYKIEV